MIHSNKHKIKKQAMQAFPDYGRQKAEKSRPGWRDALSMVGGALMDFDGTMGGGNMQGAMSRSQNRIRLMDEEKQAEIDRKRRMAILDGMNLSPRQRALMELNNGDRGFIYGMGRDDIGDDRAERAYSDSRTDRASDMKHRDRTYDRGVLESDRSHLFREDESERDQVNRDRTHGFNEEQFGHRKKVDNANLALKSEELARKRDEADAEAARGGYSPTEIRAFRDKGEQLQTFQRSLNSYVSAIKREGVQAWDIGGRNKTAAELDAMRQDLMFQGKNLWELGVLSKDDYDNMEKAIPDATGLGVWINGTNTALVKAGPLVDTINYQLGRIPEQFRSYEMETPNQGEPTLASQYDTPEDALRANPNLAASYDKRYGEGAAARVLGGQ